MLLDDHILFDCRMPAMAQVLLIRGRKPRPVPCTHRLKAAVRRIDAGEARFAVAVPSRGEEPRRILAWDGRLWLACAGHTGTRTFSPVDRIHLGNMFMGRLISESNPICMPAADIEIPLLGVRELVDDGLADAEAELARKTQDLLFIDDVLYRTIPRPQRRTCLAARGRDRRVTSQAAVTGSASVFGKLYFGRFGVVHGALDAAGHDAYVRALCGVTGAESPAPVFEDIDLSVPELREDEASLLSTSLRNLVVSFGLECDVAVLDDGQFDAWLAVRAAFDAGNDIAMIEAFADLVRCGEHPETRLLSLASAGDAMRLRITSSPVATESMLAVARDLDLFEWGQR